MNCNQVLKQLCVGVFENLWFEIQIVSYKECNILFVKIYV
jgi:hypothetical protein